MSVKQIVSLHNLLKFCVLLAAAAVSHVRGECGHPGRPHLGEVVPDKTFYAAGEVLHFHCPQSKYDSHLELETRECTRSGIWTDKIGRCDERIKTKIRDLKIYDMERGFQKAPTIKLNQSSDSLFSAASPPERISSPTNNPQIWFVELADKVELSFVEIKLSPIITSDSLETEKDFDRAFRLFAKVHKCHLESYHNVISSGNSTVEDEYYAEESVNFDDTPEFPESQPLGAEERHRHISSGSKAEENNDPTSVLWFRCHPRPNSRGQTAADKLDLIFNFYGNVTLRELNLYKAPSECGDPELPPNTDVIRDPTDPNRLIYSCDNRKFIAYNFTTTCDSRTHSWLPFTTSPVCNPHTVCQYQFESDAALRGQVLTYDGLYRSRDGLYAIPGTKLLYKCINPTDTLVGNSERVCTEAGTWSPDEPRCQSATSSTASDLVKVPEPIEKLTNNETLVDPFDFVLPINSEESEDEEKDEEEVGNVNERARPPFFAPVPTTQLPPLTTRPASRASLFRVTRRPTNQTRNLTSRTRT